MSPSESPLALLSLEMGLLISIGGALVVLYLAGASLRQSTSYVARFWPTWGRTYAAIACAFVLSLVAGIIIRAALGLEPGRPNLPSVLWTFPAGLLCQMVAYKAILGEPRSRGVSFPQAALVVLLNLVILLLSFAGIGIIIAVGVVMSGGTLPDLTRANVGKLSSLPTMWKWPRFSFATLADAQREAMNRHPQLAVPGSPMNKLFLERYHLYQKTKPEFFRTNAWPVQLADEVALDPRLR